MPDSRFLRTSATMTCVIAMLSSSVACDSSTLSRKPRPPETDAGRDAAARDEDASRPKTNPGKPKPSPEGGVPDASADASVPTRDAASDGAADAIADASNPEDTGALSKTAEVFTVGAGGTLDVFSTNGRGAIGNQIAGSPFTFGVEGDSVTGNGAGTRVYAGGASNSNGLIGVFLVDATGRLSGQQVGSPFATVTARAPTRLALRPAGGRLYAASQGVSGGAISVFALDTNGNLTGERPGSPTGLGTPSAGTFGVSVNPAATRLYVTSQEARGVYVFALDGNGDISGGPVSGSPFLTGLSDAPLLSVVHPTGNVLYATDQNGNLLTYALDANGDITSFANVSCPGNSIGLAINHAGTRLYVATGGTTVAVYSLDATTGAINGAPVSFAVGIGAYDLALDRAETNLYVADANGSRLASVVLNPSGDAETLQPVASPGVTYPTAVFAR